MLVVVSIVAMRQIFRSAVRRTLLAFPLLLIGCAASPPAVDVAQSPCEQVASRSPSPGTVTDPPCWLDQKGSLRLEFEIEGLDPLDTTHAPQIQVATAVRARLREAGIPGARVSWMNLRQIVVDLPPLGDPSALERARESLRAPGLPARLVFTVESLVGPAVP